MKIDVTFNEVDSDFNVNFNGVSYPLNSTTDHSQLTNRDKEEQHPISAITDLENALNDKLSNSALPSAIDEALAQAKISGKFDGKDGKDGLIPYIADNGNWWIGDEDTGISAAVEQNVGSYEEFFENATKGTILRYYGSAEKNVIGNYDFYTTDFIQVYEGDVLHYKLSGIVGIKNVTSSLFHVYDSNKNLITYVRPTYANALTEDTYSFTEDCYIRLCHGVYDDSGLTEELEKVLNSGEVYIERYVKPKDVVEITKEVVNGKKFNIAVLSDSIFSLSGGTSANALKNKTTILDYLQKIVDCDYFNCAVAGSCAYGRDVAPGAYEKALDFEYLSEAIVSNDFSKQIEALGNLEVSNQDVTVDKILFFVEAAVSGITTTPYTYIFTKEGNTWVITNANGDVLASTEALSDYGITISNEEIDSFTVIANRNTDYQAHVAVHLQTAIDLCNETNLSGKNPEGKTWSDIDILIVNYGGNDFAKGTVVRDESGKDRTYNITPDQTKQALLDGIVRLMNKYPNLRVIISTPYYQFTNQTAAMAQFDDEGQDILDKASCKVNYMTAFNRLSGNEGVDRFKFVYGSENKWTYDGAEIDLEIDFHVKANFKDGITLTPGSYFVISWTTEDCMEYQNGAKCYLKDYAAAEKELAEELCLHFFDNLTHYGWNRYNKTNYFNRSDGKHPREEGAEYMANKLYENMKSNGLLGKK